MISDDELISELKRLADELGETPTQREMDEMGEFSYKPYKNHFGSWNEALREAGLPTNAEPSCGSNEELISELQRLAEELGGTPTTSQMNEQGKFGARTYHGRFESWNKALREAGLPINNELNFGSKEELISELQRLAEELGETPSRNVMNEQGKFSYTQYRHRFGSWNKALREAGLSVNKEHNICSKEELISELQRLADELGKTPIAKDMKNSGKFSIGPYENNFGSWNEALREAGLPINNELNFGSKEELISELKRLANGLEKTPSVTEMKERGKFSAGQYENRFGSWNEALRAAGLDPIQEYPIETEWTDNIENYYGDSWPTMRSKALDRDEHTCQSCGETDNIHVHHITPRRCFENPDDSNTMDNLISLCNSCHGRFEGQWMDCSYEEFKAKIQHVHGA